ncbi:MAG: pentapeptide repeat-containing protein [Elainellaceae cyanobacterium]
MDIASRVDLPTMKIFLTKTAILAAGLSSAILSSVVMSSVARAEDIAQVQQLVSTRICRACDLSRASLVHTDLSGIDAQGSNFSFANLNRSRLAGADLRGADLSNAVLFNADLTGADLTGANLQGADLRDTFLHGATLDGVILQGANLQGAVGLPEQFLSARTLYQWGQQEAERGNFQDAYTYYTRAIAIAPDAPYLYLGRSVILYRWGHTDEAIADARQAERLFIAQGNVSAQQTAASFAQTLGEQQEARAEAQSQGSSGFLNVVSGVAGLLLRFGLPFF